MISDVQSKAVENILFNCGDLQSTDRVLILCNSSTRDLAEAFTSRARNVNPTTVLMEIPALPNHGAEPGEETKAAMCRATLILSLCRYSLAHSQARLDSAHAGARFLSLPLYDWDLLNDECLRIDYSAQAGRVQRFADAFTNGNEIHVTTAVGTNIRLGISGRTGNYCPGLVKVAGDLGSPPDIEANVSPIENSAEGIVVVDGSITMPGLGLLNAPVELEVRSGRVVAFRSSNSTYVSFLNELFGDTDSPRRVVAECGVGLNPAAKLTGTMLTDEGALGCVHFGLGANHTMGGLNRVDFHLDFVFRDVSLSVDGQQLLNMGVPLI
jgi:leucyl aminopeptidase (aminopeptidase T)